VLFVLPPEIPQLCTILALIN